ncbi:hypothetical protein ABE522_08730 [Stenotrophomonas pennii]|uniref:HNH endonuclease n=1 Tax=Stenotrophomonas lacuserhaii TaxID=2760084 RepID=UPI00320A93FA
MNNGLVRPPSGMDIGVSTAKYFALVCGLTDRVHWEAPPAHLEADLKTLKSSLKDHFYYGQARRCCYCGIELPNNKLAYQLDHVISRNDRADFMVCLLNLAVACGPCNGAKSKKAALATGIVAAELAVVPMSSEAYAIVHPQFDEWGIHLRLDEFNRVLHRTEKGRCTITICKIDKLNAARLSDHFAAGDRPKVVDLVVRVGSYKQKGRKIAAIQLLEKLARRGSHRARVAVGRISLEVM